MISAGVVRWVEWVFQWNQEETVRGVSRGNQCLIVGFTDRWIHLFGLGGLV